MNESKKQYAEIFGGLRVPFNLKVIFVGFLAVLLLLGGIYVIQLFAEEPYLVGRSFDCVFQKLGTTAHTFYKTLYEFFPGQKVDFSEWQQDLDGRAVVAVLSWIFIILLFFGGIICRLTAIRIAKAESSSVKDAICFMWRRKFSLILTPLFMVLTIFLLYGCNYVIGSLASSLSTAGPIIFILLFVFVVFLTILMVCMIVALLFGIHLIPACIAAEGCDGIETFITIFNYIFARPWSYILYNFMMAFSLLLVLFFGSMFLDLAYQSSRISESSDILSYHFDKTEQIVRVNYKSQEGKSFPAFYIKYNEWQAVKEEYDALTEDVKITRNEPKMYEASIKDVWAYICGAVVDSWILDTSLNETVRSEHQMQLSDVWKLSKFWATIAAILSALYYVIVFGIWGYFIAYLFAASTTIYYLLRKEVEDRSFNEVWCDEEHDKFVKTLHTIQAKTLADYEEKSDEKKEDAEDKKEDVDEKKEDAEDKKEDVDEKKEDTEDAKLEKPTKIVFKKAEEAQQKIETEKEEIVAPMSSKGTLKFSFKLKTSEDEKQEESKGKKDVDEKKEDAEDKKEDVDEKKEDAEDKKEDAEDKKEDAEDKKEDAEDKKEDADEKKEDVEDKKEDAEDKKEDVEDKKEDAEDKKEDAEDKKEDTEDKKEDIEDKKEDVKEETKKPKKLFFKKGLEKLKLGLKEQEKIESEKDESKEKESETEEESKDEDTEDIKLEKPTKIVFKKAEEAQQKIETEKEEIVAPVPPKGTLKFSFKLKASEDEKQEESKEKEEKVEAHESKEESKDKEEKIEAHESKEESKEKEEKVEAHESKEESKEKEEKVEAQASKEESKEKEEKVEAQESKEESASSDSSDWNSFESDTTDSSTPTEKEADKDEAKEDDKEEDKEKNEKIHMNSDTMTIPLMKRSTYRYSGRKKIEPKKDDFMD